MRGERTERIEGLVRGELSKYFGDDVDFELRFVSELDRGEGKPQYFESSLTPTNEKVRPVEPA